MNTLDNSVFYSVSVWDSVENSIRDSIWCPVEDSVWYSSRDAVVHSVYNFVYDYTKESVWISLLSAVRKFSHDYSG